MPVGDMMLACNYKITRIEKSYILWCCDEPVKTFSKIEALVKYITEKEHAWSAKQGV